VARTTSGPSLPFMRYLLVDTGGGVPQERNLASSKLNDDLIAPVELIIAGRVATACLSVASVILGGTIGARFAGNRPGLVAMLLMAVCPALVTRGSIVIADTFATFFVLVVLYFCARIQMERARRFGETWRSQE
jgi:dolichyl-phosphate-mannose--protein O-mannosyl transferase